MHDALAARHPIGRLGAAGEVAHPVSFLLSEKASFVSGAGYLPGGRRLNRPVASR